MDRQKELEAQISALKIKLRDLIGNGIGLYEHEKFEIRQRRDECDGLEKELAALLQRRYGSIEPFTVVAHIEIDEVFNDRAAASRKPLNRHEADKLY